MLIQTQFSVQFIQKVRVDNGVTEARQVLSFFKESKTLNLTQMTYQTSKILEADPAAKLKTYLKMQFLRSQPHHQQTGVKLNETATSTKLSTHSFSTSSV